MLEEIKILVHLSFYKRIDKTSSRNIIISMTIQQTE